MLKNYLLVSLRYLKNDRLFSGIRLGNLIIGIAVSLLCWIYIDYEMSYENSFDNGQDIYRLQHQTPDALWAATPRAAGVYAYENIPNVVSMVRLYPESSLVRIGDKTFKEDHVLLCDSTIFDIFHYEVLRGNLKTSLVKSLTVVLTESTARRYFGNDTDLGLGQRLVFDFDDEQPRVVTAIIKDPPSNSHIQFDFLASIYSDDPDYKAYNRSWSNWGTYTYLLLSPGSNHQKITELIAREYSRQYKMEDSDFFEVELMPLKKIHLYSNAEKEFSVNANPRYLYIFGFAGLFVLIISTLNFVNLTLAKFMDRAKEIGLRKSVGASPTAVGVQFLMDVYLQISAAGVLAILLAYLLLPFFRELSGLPLPFAILSTQLIAAIIMIMAMLGLVAGSYPAIIASRYRPVVILTRNRGTEKLESFNLRQFLSIAQFSMSVILIVGSIIIYRQSIFIHDKDLGLHGNQVIIAKINAPMRGSLHSLESELRRVPGIAEVSHSSSVPGYRIMQDEVTSMSSGIVQPARLLLTSETFIETFNLDIVKGRSFSRNLPEGKSEWVLNEETARLLFESRGAEPIGQRLAWDKDTADVVGIVRNFNFESLHESVGPLAIRRGVPGWSRDYLSIGFDARRTGDVLAGLKKTYAAVYPNLPMIEPELLDDRFGHLYEAERKLQSLVLIFCCISIMLTISGIFALSTHYARRRAKEIAVRKLLGSSVSGILKLLTKHFLLMVVISLAVAVPLSFFLNTWWLDQFAYKVNSGVLPYLIGGISILFIVLLSSSLSTINAALTNPVRWLRESRFD